MDCRSGTSKIFRGLTDRGAARQSSLGLVVEGRVVDREQPSGETPQARLHLPQ
jgi:hypothetical protein